MTFKIYICIICVSDEAKEFKLLSAKFIKWSNTLKQIVGNLPTICLSVFDHFSGLALKGLNNIKIIIKLQIIN